MSTAHASNHVAVCSTRTQKKSKFTTNGDVIGASWKIDTIPCPLKVFGFCIFLQPKNWDNPTLLKMVGSCNFFVNQSEASKDGVLGVHFRPKEFK